MDLLTEIGYRPAWMLDAACAEHPEINWFPERGERRDAAISTCARCLVAGECREFALDMGGDVVGVWAGTTQRERRRLLADREPPPGPPCPVCRASVPQLAKGRSRVVLLGHVLREGGTGPTQRSVNSSVD